jgi:hypothetical protein
MRCTLYAIQIQKHEGGGHTAQTPKKQQQKEEIGRPYVLFIFMHMPCTRTPCAWVMGV